MEQVPDQGPNFVQGFTFIKFVPEILLKMPGRLKIILRCSGLFLFLGSVTVNCQILQDTAAMNLVRRDIDYIYNLQFNEARELYTKIIRLYPDHPIGCILRGMMTYWENYPMLHTNPSHEFFEEDMRKCINLSEKNDNPDYEAEFLLADLCARGMLVMFYEENALISEVIPLAIGSYKHLMRAFHFTAACTDLYYFTGLYNYYREAYPRAYPVYKSLVVPFPRGDMEIGLLELQTAAESSLVLRAESCVVLTWIFLNFERKYAESLHYCRILYEQYNANIFYLATYIKDLLLMKKYDEAEKLILASPEAENNYFQAQLIILKGILQEKKYLDKNLAQQYYFKGISDLSLFDEYGKEYAAYAYFGLSRISEANGEIQTSKTFRRQAIKLADFKEINFDR